MKVKLLACAERIVRVKVVFPEEFPVDDYTAWRYIDHSHELADEIYPEGTGKYGKKFMMIFVKRDGPTIVHLTRGCQVLTETERGHMLGILIDRELAHRMELCDRCRRRWDTGMHRPRSSPLAWSSRR